MLSKNPVERDEKNQFVHGLTKLQKRVVIVLVFLAILIIVFWLLQFRHQLRSPFNAGGNQAVTSKVSIDKKIDTDHDGLSDYDEIHKYKTSPYLKDTDSDGISDYDEIKNGTDPNCPQGKVCYNGTASEATNRGTQGGTTTIINNTNNSVNTSTNLDSSKVDKNIMQQLLAGKDNASVLRQALIQSGASKTMLDKISDEDLMRSYQKVLNNQNK